MSRKLGICAGFVLLLANLAPEVSGQDQRLVGGFSDLSQTEIHGLRTFTAEKVREELARDSEAIFAAHPLAHLEDLPTLVSQRLLAGFHRTGFADADVRTEIDFDASRLIATVTEGPRFLNGSVRIENSMRIDIDRLTQRLTQRYSPREAVTPVFDETATGHVAHWLDKDGKKVDWPDPVWTTDQPARLDAGSKAMYQRKVSHALEDLGFRDAEFHVVLEPNRENRRVDLVVRLRDEGHPAKLGRIEIHGNERDSTEAIIHYSNLPVGTLMTRQRETQLRYDLWRSGRFLSTEVELLPPFVNSGHILVLTVKDSPYSPPIDQPLTKEEQTLLKLGRWLVDTDAWSGDLVLRARGKTNEMTAIMAAQEGLLVSVRSLDTDTARSVTLVGSRHEIGCYPSRSSIHLQAAVTPAVSLTLRLACQLNDDPEDPDIPFSVNFGAGLETREAKDTAPPLGIEFQLAPVTCLAIAHVRKAESTWEDDTLIIESDKDRFEIDSRDGRLIRHMGRLPQYETELAFEEGAFSKALDTAHHSALEGENVFHARRPLRSTFNFLLRKDMLDDWEMLMQVLGDNEGKGRDTDLIGLWSKFISMGVLDPVDEYLTNRQPDNDSEDKFKIPDAHSDAPVSWQKELAFAMVPLSDDFFPRDSWAWTVRRETGFAIAGRGQYMGQQVQRIYQSNEFGPVGVLVLARLLYRTNPQIAQSFAQRGTLHMSANDFRKDYLPFLDDTRITGKCVRRACEILRALNASEHHELLAQVPDEWSSTFESFSKELRRETHRPIDEAVPAALDAAWGAGLSIAIEQRLIEICDRDAVRLGNAGNAERHTP